jgi:hypothetical protein
MPIYPLLRSQAFDPELINTMAIVFEDILRDSKLTDRTDPLATIIANKVIEVVQTGERDPQRIREKVLQSMNTAL